MTKIRTTTSISNVGAIRLNNFVTPDGFQIVTVQIFDIDDNVLTGYEVNCHRSSHGEMLNVFVDSDVPNVTVKCDPKEINIDECAKGMNRDWIVQQ
jgi:hypothetical protein